MKKKVKVRATEKISPSFILKEGEEVVISEKLHGTWTCIGFLPKKYAHPTEGRLIVTSKGLSARGLALKFNAEANENNLYVRVAKHYNMENRISFAFGYQIKDEIDPQPVYVLGESFGIGCQDLGYGHNTNKDETIGFRIFDVYVGLPGRGRYLNDEELNAACKRLGLKRVPVLYRGPFSKEKLYEYTDGLETISGKQIHVREGVVIRPVIERQHPEIGRTQLKSVSGNYLCRKSSNATEYQ